MAHIHKVVDVEVMQARRCDLCGFVVPLCSRAQIDEAIQFEVMT